VKVEPTPDAVAQSQRMTKGAFRKIGWTWTARQGWKRIPRRLQAVKLVPVPKKKRKTRKVRRISQAAPKPEKMAVAEVPQIATEQGRADSAPTPAPKPEKLTTRQIRRTWGGKYADLTPQSHTPTGGQGAGQ
jgi:hypothetical protein